MYTDRCAESRGAQIMRAAPITRPMRVTAPLSHVAGVTERITSRLRPHAEAVRLVADGNPVRELTCRSIEDVHLVVVAAGYPQLLSVGGDVAHVGAPTAGNRPVGHDLVGQRIQHAD